MICEDINCESVSTRFITINFGIKIKVFVCDRCYEKASEMHTVIQGFIQPFVEE